MFQAGQRVRTTDNPLSTCLRNQRGAIVERYRNPLTNYTGPVEYLVRFDNGSEYFVAEHFLRVEYLGVKPVAPVVTPYYRIHPEHDASRSEVLRLCEDHLRTAEACNMVDERDVPEIESACFCPTCHFCDN